MSPTQLVGFFLWRAGLLLVAGYSAFRAARLALRFIDLPSELEVGLGLVLAGAFLVLLSLVLERIVDAREERRLAE